jgi:hypothetical protein
MYSEPPVNLRGAITVGTVVNFDQHKQVKEQRIVTQEKRAQEALMAASVEFRRLAELKGDR